MQLAKSDDHEGDAAITHLSYMYHCKVPVNRPRENCFYCQKRHLGACPFQLVSVEMVQNINNPVVLYLRNLLQFYFHLHHHLYNVQIVMTPVTQHQRVQFQAAHNHKVQGLGTDYNNKLYGVNVSSVTN
jgi:hypothetical protein